MFDIKTILFSNFLNQLIVSIVMLMIYSINKKRIPGLGFWTVNIWMQTIAMFFLAGIDSGTVFLSEFVSNLLMIGGSLCFYLGFYVFDGRALSFGGRVLRNRAGASVSLNFTEDRAGSPESRPASKPASRPASRPASKPESRTEASEKTGFMNYAAVDYAADYAADYSADDYADDYAFVNDHPKSGFDLQYLIYFYILYGLLLFLFTMIFPNLLARNLLFSVACVFVGIMYLQHFIKEAAEKKWHKNYFNVLMVLYTLFTLNYVLRIVLMILNPEQVVEITSMETVLLPLTTLITLTLLMAVNYTIIILINGKLVHDLEEDAAERETWLKQLKRLSETDSLTGSFNRMTLEQKLKTITNVSVDSEEDWLAVLIDVDHFKAVNDSQGHNAGDQVLKDIASTMVSLMSGNDCFGRWGGDEFLVLKRLAETEKADLFASQLQELIRSSFSGVTVSAGCTLVQSDDNTKSVITRADSALYQAKNSGRDTYCILE